MRAYNANASAATIAPAETVAPVPVGTKVTVVDQEAKMGWIGDDLFVDLHFSPSHPL